MFNGIVTVRFHLWLQRKAALKEERDREERRRQFWRWFWFE